MLAGWDTITHDMPISEDEYDQNQRQSSNMQSGMSKAEQRRSNKPIMEKRRRARINHCLNELKSLILDAMKKDPARHSKLEKADILEMTVKHLQSIQRQQLAVAVATDPTVLHKFKSGFNECATEVSRYISKMEDVENSVKQRLVAHLRNCVNGLQQISPFSFNTSANTFTGNSAISIIPQRNTANSDSLEDVNNNNHNARIQVPAGLQLIPSRLPTGELALLVPNSSNIPFFSQAFGGEASPVASQLASNPSSAFTTVRPHRTADLKLRSPPMSPASSTASYDDHSLDNFHRPRTPNKDVAVPYQEPPQQFHVTSTSYSPEAKTDSSSLKIEYKSVPIYQPNEKQRDSHTYKYQSRSTLEPLSVITNSEKSKDYFEHRKRPYPSEYSSDHECQENPPGYRYPPENHHHSSSESSSGLLSVVVRNESPQPSTSKYAKLSMEDSLPCSSSSNSSPELHRYPNSNNNNNQYQNQSFNINDPHRDANNESMWRPW